MSLQLIIGSPGSGKTWKLYQELIRLSLENPEGNHIALVPEQATMQAQKDMVTMHPAGGVMNIDILSFERLAYRVFEESGCAPQVVLDDMGKNMLLRKAAGQVADRLKVYRKNLSKAGFINELKSMLSEFYQYRIDLADMERLIGETMDRPLLNRKLKDLETLYRSFASCMGEGMITAEELLEVLCRVLPQSEKIRDSVITLDGYTGFTPVQYEVIRQLLKSAKKVVVTITIDDQEDPYRLKGDHELFFLSKKTVHRLNEIALEEGIERDEDIRIGGEVPYRFKKSGALACIEREIFRYPYRTYEEKTEDVSVHRAKNPAGEVCFAVQEIFRLIREEGLRYRDIAVITGDICGYKPFVEKYFKEGRIPYFMDDKRSLIANLLVEYIRAVLEVLEKDFSYESVFRYLKCGFLEENEQAVDELENYVLACGIRGYKRWQEEWEGLYSGGEHLNMEWLNKKKAELMEPVFMLRNELVKKEMTIREAMTALFGWLDSQKADIRLAALQEEFELSGQYSLAKEYSQAYRLVLGVFDQITGLLGDEPVTLKELREVLDTGFQEVKAGLIPSCIDRVVIGDIQRSRLKDIKVLFILGMNDGIIPASGDRGGILSETDRELLKDYQIELAPGQKEKGFIEKFYLYLALTRPSERLYLCFSACSAQGKSIRPSGYLNYLLKLFPGMQIADEEENAEGTGSFFKQVVTEEAAKTLLVKGMREYKESEDSRAWRELYSWFYKKEEERAFLLRLIDNGFGSHFEEGIGRQIAKMLYGERMSGSVTRLEQYAACAYAQFLSYGLELMERREYSFAAVDMGNLFHASIERYFHYLREHELDAAMIEEEKRKAVVKECVRQAAEENGGAVLKSSARNQYICERVERIIDKTVWALGEQLARGKFVPSAFELSFGRGENEAMVLPLSEKGEMLLKGRIDRMDLYEDEEKVYVKIIDYKSGSTDFDLPAVYHGLQLQLVVYLDAAIQREEKRHGKKRIVPAGMFYYTIQDPVVDRENGLNSEQAKKKSLEKLRLKGLVNRDKAVIDLFEPDREGKSAIIPVTIKDGAVVEGRSSVAGEIQFTHLRKHVRKKMIRFAEEIASGKIEAVPYKRKGRTGCDYCRFGAVCGFDQKLPGCHYRRLNDKKSEEIWKAIKEEEVEDEYGMDETAKAGD